MNELYTCKYMWRNWFNKIKKSKTEKGKQKVLGVTGFKQQYTYQIKWNDGQRCGIINHNAKSINYLLIHFTVIAAKSFSYC